MTGANTMNTHHQATGSSIGSKRAPRMKRPFGAWMRFLRSTNGVTAVEFGFVALPFFALLLAILQLGVVMIAQEVLQTATNQTARLIMTGQAQTGGMTSGQFQAKVCANATSLFSCGGIYVNVQTFSTFSGVAMTNPVNNGVFNPGSLQYTPGGKGDIVVIQTFYQWPVIPVPLGFGLNNLGNGKMLMVATAAFRNEPY